MSMNADEHSVGAAIIALMNGVLYREASEVHWATLTRRGTAVRDHFAQVGVEVIHDEVEGYAYLRVKETVEGDTPLPSLIRRAALTFSVSLLLVLLRKKLLEFDASGGEGKLVVERDQIVEMLRVFQEESSNETSLATKADGTIANVVKLGYLLPLRGQDRVWEVPRILKAYVDAETLQDFATTLDSYRQSLAGNEDSNE